jgi:RimJ/RimL family protein N-acetyltransferase
VRAAGGEWGCRRAKAIGVERSGQLIGGVVFDNYNGASVCMHVGSDGSRRWLSREFLRAFFGYAFDQMRVKKIIGPSRASNRCALDFDKHIGFVEEVSASRPRQTAGTRDPLHDSRAMPLDPLWVRVSLHPTRIRA